MTDYVNFELRVSALAGGSYRASVESPAGEGSIEFSSPFSADEVEGTRRNIGRAARSTHKPIESRQRLEASVFGQALYRQLMVGTVGRLFEQTTIAADASDDHVRLRLRLDDAPDLMAVPWEYLCDPGSRLFMAPDERFSIVRYMGHGAPVEPLTVDGPINILVMISNPVIDEIESLQVEEELRRVEKQFESVIQQGLATVTRLPAGTMAALESMLDTDRQFHIFHYIGHGEYRDAGSYGVLLLENESGGPEPKMASDIATLLQSHESLRLAVLNSCEGAMTTGEGPFGGAAQGLIRAGVPAVVAMQFEVSDDAAIAFAERFYETLIAKRRSVDEAVARGRRRLFAETDIEWGTPVLYMRANSGQLFSPKEDRKGAHQGVWARVSNRLGRSGLTAFGVLAVILIVVGLIWSPWDNGSPDAGLTTTTTSSSIPTTSTSSPQSEDGNGGLLLTGEAPQFADPTVAQSPQVTGQFASTIPIIDADVSEWVEVSETYESATQLGIDDRYRSPDDDLGVLWKTSWDSGYLYLAIEVTDDRFFAAEPGSRTLGDSLEVFISGRDVDSHGLEPVGLPDYKFEVSPGDFKTQTPSIAAWRGALLNDSTFQRMTSVEAVVGSVAFQGGYRLELAIPWSAPLAEVVPLPNDRFFFTVKVIDVDEAGASSPETVVVNNADHNDGLPGTWSRLSLTTGTASEVTGPYVGPGAGSGEWDIIWDRIEDGSVTAYALYRSAGFDNPFVHVADVKNEIQGWLGDSGRIGFIDYEDFSSDSSFEMPLCYSIAAVNESGREGPRSPVFCFSG